MPSKALEKIDLFLLSEHSVSLKLAKQKYERSVVIFYKLFDTLLALFWGDQNPLASLLSIAYEKVLLFLSSSFILRTKQNSLRLVATSFHFEVPFWCFVPKNSRGHSVNNLYDTSRKHRERLRYSSASPFHQDPLISCGPLLKTPPNTSWRIIKKCFCHNETISGKLNWGSKNMAEIVLPSCSCGAVRQYLL